MSKDQDGIILRTELVPIDSIKPYPGNARIGNVDVIRESLRTNKQYRPVVVQDSTKYILAGNHTWKSAKLEKHEEIWATFLDCDDLTARRINLVDNRSAELGVYDNEALVALLGDLPTLEGTGWTGEDMEKLIGTTVGADDVPDVPDDAYKSQFGVIVLCEDAERQQQVYEALKGIQAENLAFVGTELKVVAV